MLFFIGFIVGIAVGVTVKVIFLHSKPVGTICVYENDEGGEPYMFLVVDRDISYLLSRKRVLLKIERRENPAQK